jgi:hypothetical protein
MSGALAARRGTIHETPIGTRLGWLGPLGRFGRLTGRPQALSLSDLTIEVRGDGQHSGGRV